MHWIFYEGKDMLTEGKNFVKKLSNLWEVQNAWGFLPHEFSDHDMVFKTLLKNVFLPTITHIKIFEKIMKKYFLKF